MLTNWKRAILYSGYLLITALVLLEIGIRIWGYSEPHIYDPIYMPFELSEDIPYIHKPNLVQAHARGLAVINTDSLGLRAKTAGEGYGPKQPREYRIAIVGASYTFGEGVPKTEDTYAQVLEDTLNRQPNLLTVKVFNFGASAYTVKQMAATLQHRIVSMQPDLVVMALSPEDFTRHPIFIDKAGYLVDQRSAILLDSPVRKVLRGIHLLYVLRDVGLRQFFTPGSGPPLFSQGEIPDSYRYVQQFKEMANRFGFSYLIVLLPRMQENAWGHLTDRLDQDAVRYLDLSHLMKELTRDQYMASRFDRHPSPTVHRRIGISLADYLRTHQGYLP